MRNLAITDPEQSRAFVPERKVFLTLVSSGSGETNVYHSTGFGADIEFDTGLFTHRSVQRSAPTKLFEAAIDDTIIAWEPVTLKECIADLFYEAPFQPLFENITSDVQDTSSQTTTALRPAKEVIETDQILKLKDLCTFRNPENVRTFLSGYPHVVTLVSEALAKIPSYFPESRTFLEVTVDPEGDRNEELVLSIKTALDPSEALNRLDRFDDHWWLGAVPHANGKLCINLEFE